jgi:uncharacterized protein YndB with AHSA1/START domain
MIFADGTVGDAGEVLEIEKPKRLVFRWRNEFMPELRAEGYSRCAFDIEGNGNVTKLTVTRDRQDRIEIHRSRVGRLAESSVEPEEPARDRRGSDRR